MQVHAPTLLTGLAQLRHLMLFGSARSRPRLPNLAAYPLLDSYELSGFEVRGGGDAGRRSGSGSGGSGGGSHSSG